MAANSIAVKALSQELKTIQESPLEGCETRLINDSDLFKWEVVIFGPPETLLQGGYFKAHMEFPQDYPFSPPTVRFVTDMFHPNVYKCGDRNGLVCISILHPPIDDPQSGESLGERWNPAQNIRTILLSIVSLLNEPNTSSPANVDASVSYRQWQDSQTGDYLTRIINVVEKSKEDAEKDGVVVPTTTKDYIKKSIYTKPEVEDISLQDDFYDNDSSDDVDELYDEGSDDDDSIMESDESDQEVVKKAKIGSDDDDEDSKDEQVDSGNDSTYFDAQNDGRKDN